MTCSQSCPDCQCGSELLPCPFCGGEPEIVTLDVEPQGDPWYGRKNETFVLCNCGACLFDGGFHEGFWDHETRAPEAWNRRATLPSAAPSAERGGVWRDVVRDGMPTYQPDVTYVGINSAGYAACFTIVEPDGTCWAEGAEESVCVMSELRQWRVLDRPGASPPPARNGELSESEILALADASELPYTVGEPDDGPLYVTWPDRVVTFARAILSAQKGKP